MPNNVVIKMYHQLSGYHFLLNLHYICKTDVLNTKTISESIQMSNI